MSHLGGHLNITHIDCGALEWLKDQGTKTLLDIGCSVGGQVHQAILLGMNAYGLEGDYSLLQEDKLKVPHRIFFSDFTKTFVQMPILFDAIWCVEVAEHIEEKHLLNLFFSIYRNLKLGGYLVFTANEGPGIHHVTRKPAEWWIRSLRHEGLEFNEALTKDLRAASTMEREFIRDTGMVFVRY